MRCGVGGGGMGAGVSGVGIGGSGDGGGAGGVRSGGVVSCCGGCPPCLATAQDTVLSKAKARRIHRTPRF